MHNNSLQIKTYLKARLNLLYKQEYVYQYVEYTYSLQCLV